MRFSQRSYFVSCSWKSYNYSKSPRTYARLQLHVRILLIAHIVEADCVQTVEFGLLSAVEVLFAAMPKFGHLQPCCD